MQQLDLQDLMGEAGLDPNEASGAEISELTEALLYLFGWGMLSAPMVGWLARVGVKGQEAKLKKRIMSS